MGDGRIVLVNRHDMETAFGNERSKPLQAIAGLTGPATPCLAMCLLVMVSVMDVRLRRRGQARGHHEKASAEKDGHPQFNTSSVVHTPNRW